jgi:hypothetical protein
MKTLRTLIVFSFLFAGVSMAVIESCNDRGGVWNEKDSFCEYKSFSSN